MTRRGERGSALLIVLVFSAIVLIMLYRELPVAMFEAQRQKEELSVERGHEYQRAVQLFYRRFRGQYPASIDQLQNTNGIRFLRRKYKDPLTGKDDWRLLHAGPGGMLTDSKVNPLKLPNAAGNQAGQTGGAQTANQQTSNTQSGFGATTPDANATDTNSADNTSADGQAGSRVRRSPPAIASNQNGGAANPDAANGQTPTTAELNADPSKPLLPTTNSSDTSTTASNPPATNTPGTPGTNPLVANGAVAPSAGQAGMNAVTGNIPNQLTGNGLQNGAAAGTGAISAGGIAGVASIAKGHSIKKVNDQQEYSKWEFYYDPTKDTGANGQNGTQNNGNNGQPIQQLPGTTTPNTQQQSTFGSTSATSTPTSTTQ